MEKDNQDDVPADEQRKSTGRGAGPGLLIPLIVIAILSGLWLMLNAGPQRTVIPYSFFLKQLEAKNVVEVKLSSESAKGRFRDPPLLPQSPAEGSASPKETPKEGEKAKTPPLKPERAKEHFYVKLPAWSKDNPELSLALANSGAVYDNAVEFDPTYTVFATSILLTIGLFAFFWIWLRRQQNQMMGGGFLTGLRQKPGQALRRRRGRRSRSKTWPASKG